MIEQVVDNLWLSHLNTEINIGDTISYVYPEIHTLLHGVIIAIDKEADEDDDQYAFISLDGQQEIGTPYDEYAGEYHSMILRAFSILGKPSKSVSHYKYRWVNLKRIQQVIPRCNYIITFKKGCRIE